MKFCFEINHSTSVNKLKTKKKAKKKKKKNVVRAFFVRLTWTPLLTKIPGSAHGSRQLIGMTTVNLGVVCKLIFAFLTENIGVSVRSIVSSCRLSISLHISIAQYHKSSSVENGPAPTDRVHCKMKYRSMRSDDRS